MASILSQLTPQSKKISLIQMYNIILPSMAIIGAPVLRLEIDQESTKFCNVLFDSKMCQSND